MVVKCDTDMFNVGPNEAQVVGYLNLVKKTPLRILKEMTHLADFNEQETAYYRAMASKRPGGILLAELGTPTDMWSTHARHYGRRVVSKILDQATLNLTPATSSTLFTMISRSASVMSVRYYVSAEDFRLVMAPNHGVVYGVDWSDFFPAFGPAPTGDTYVEGEVLSNVW